MGFIGEGLHDPHAADVLFDTRVESANAREDCPKILCHAIAVSRGYEQNWRHNQRGQQSEVGVDRKHQCKRTEECHYRNEQIFRPVMSDFADILQILSHTRNQMPGLLFVVKRERQALQMIKCSAAHFRF